MSDKIKLWRQRLLDTGKRNKLLNFKETKRSTLKIISPEIDFLYSSILSGKTLYFPSDEEQEQIDLFDEKSLKTKKKGNILSTKNGIELTKTLYTLKSRSKSALEELGINILYLAFGFLEWTEAEYSNESILSPLLLVPVEINKESILSPYTLSLFEDDIIINPTLCYKLENDFGVKIDYEIDPENLNLNSFFEYLTGKVNVLNWRVKQDVQLSPFSFLKLNMYKDLEINESKIIQNEIIKGLCGEPCEIERVPEQIASAKELDKLLDPLETFQVVDADSSQQQAILAAKSGISFVLQGPPGTGKSQTITNIIAECLAKGKKILFVSEKMAALDVVYRNLKRVGLEDFCLQLHSHKANKALVVKELANTLNKPKTQLNGNHIEDLEVLVKEREILNLYDSELHSIRQPLGKSVYQIHGEFDKISHYPDVQFKIQNISEITLPRVNSQVDTLKIYSSCLRKVGIDFRTSCFFGFNKPRMTFEQQNDFYLHLSKLNTALSETLQIIENVRERYSLKDYEELAKLPELISLLRLISTTPFCPSNWIYKSGFLEICSEIKYVSDCYKKITERESELFSLFKEEILDLNVSKMLERFTFDYSNRFRVFNFNFQKDKKTLRGYQKVTKYKAKYSELKKILETISQIQELTAAIHSKELLLRDWLGDQYTGRNSNWQKIIRSLEWISRVKELYGNDFLTEEFSVAVCNQRASEIANSFLTDLLEKREVLTTEIDFICDFYDPTVINIPFEKIQNLIRKFRTTEEKFDYLSNWMDFVRARNACYEVNLKSFMDEIEIKRIPEDQFCYTFLKRFYSLWLDSVYSQEPILTEFHREKFESLIADFKRRDVSQFTLAKVRIRQRLSNQKPNSTEFLPRGTEINTLLRESEKRRKILPVRKLFERIPDLLLNLKPCLLMSPLSVSQFLNPALYMFDTVIFDEASQVCTENAIGAIYRGKQLIVVGDREQLPPTNFFNNSISDSAYDDYDVDEEDSDFGAYESILDECGGILNRLQLLWHYRSRDEHLIAFSNAKIYKNLITFPAPNNETVDFGVEFIHVPNGIYERSLSKTNKIEAHRVAELVFEHFDRHPKRSLGIVTFSEAQQLAIDNEILLIRKAKPQYESFFDEGKNEPFFIKNLENVQGDERDTIILSVGYGKDQNGKLNLFFGPINHEGGYRRLNVAITRAKLNVKLVSSILPTDIDLSRSGSKGIQMLRDYMEFALRGDEALIGDLSIPDTLQFDSPFEMQVYDVLVNLGHKIDTQVGCSGYKLDLAIRHPSLHGRYVLAIECDGATYHSARTARERDRLREDVLKSRGWKIYRIWSTDWIHHRTSEILRLQSAVKKAIEDSNIIETYPEMQKSEKPIEQLEQVIPHKTENPPFKPYETANINGVPQLHNRGSYDYVADVIKYVIDIESPIHKEMLYGYLASLFGNQRVTKTITYSVDYIIENFCTGQFIIKGDFFWSKKMKTPIFRIPASGSRPRELKYIAPEEICEGMMIIIARSIGIERVALFQEVTRVLGFDRTGGKINSLLDIAYLKLIDEDKIELRNQIITKK